MTEEKNEVIFDDDKISKSEEFVNPDELYQELIQCVQKYHPADTVSLGSFPFLRINTKGL